MLSCRCSGRHRGVEEGGDVVVFLTVGTEEVWKMDGRTALAQSLGGKAYKGNTCGGHGKSADADDGYL